MFKWFGGKQAEAPSSEWKQAAKDVETAFENKIVGIQNAANVLKTEINTAQHNMELLLEITTRATKDERTAIATSSLQTLKTVDMFLNKVINSYRPLYK
jgi:phosphoglycerate-specific signal transduction histidine kinase